MLKEKTFSAVRWTAGSAALRAILQLAQISILARLLAPSDYGLMAMVSVIQGYAGLFSDLGVNSAFVQKQDVTEHQRSSLFWLNIGVSTAITLTAITLSPLFSQFFGDKRLIPLITISSTTFVLNALGQQLRMHAEKNLDFRPVVISEILGSALGLTIAIVMALENFGVYSLVFSGIVSAFVGSLLSWIFIADGWRPLFHFKISDIKPFLGFGVATIGNSLVSQINVTIDLFLGGRLLTAVQLGLYSVPRNLCLQLQWMINPIITRVGFPLIAKAQSDVDLVRTIYLKTLAMTSAVNAPLYLGVAAFSHQVVKVILGDKWIMAAPILQTLALWGFVRSTANPVGSLLLGMGRADLELKWNAVLLVVYPPILWIGFQFGSQGLAWTLLIMQIILVVPSWFFLVRPLCNADLTEYLYTLTKPAAISFISLGPAILAARFIQNDILCLMVMSTIFAPIYFGISHYANRAWTSSMLQLIKY